MTMRKYIVYKITNIITNKSYIGTTSRSLSNRWAAHQYVASKNQDNYKFYNAIRKYGSLNWNLDIIFETPEKKKAFEYEIEMIDSYNTIKNGYNTSRGGEGGSHYWDILTEEEKILHNKKISISKKGISYGYHHSELTKKKLSESNKKWRADNIGYSAKRRTYICVNHNSSDYYIVNDLKKFCKEHSLRYSSMSYSSRIKKLPTSQNWSCRMMLFNVSISDHILQIDNDIKNTKKNIHDSLSSIDRYGKKNSNFKDGKRCLEK